MAKKVLVVDDSGPVRQQVSMTLQQAGYDVDEAQDGQQALEKLETAKPCLVICDVNMPRMNGIQFLEKAGTRQPVVMLTTEGNPEVKKRAKELGAKGWIIKPFKPELLIEAVRHLVGA